MKVPVSKRLLACAAYVPRGARVADVGADHGYLGIYLLREEIASRVIASDLREKPLEKARKNAARFGTAARMTFHCCDGLAAVRPGEVDVVICAGMGADCILNILRAAPWLRDRRTRLILQPQSSGQDLRRWLAEQGFALLRETLTEDGGFLYTVLEARYGGVLRQLTPGEQYVSPQLLADGSPLLRRYVGRLVDSMEQTVAGLRKGGSTEKLRYYETALAELKERAL